MVGIAWTTVVGVWSSALATDSHRSTPRCLSEVACPSFSGAVVRFLKRSAGSGVAIAVVIAVGYCIFLVFELIGDFTGYCVEYIIGGHA